MACKEICSNMNEVVIIPISLRIAIGGLVHRHGPAILLTCTSDQLNRHEGLSLPRSAGARAAATSVRATRDGRARTGRGESARSTGQRRGPVC